MDKVRIVIVGLGNMGTGHARSIIEGKVPNMELAGICDINPDRLSFAKEEFGSQLKLYANTDEMFANTKDFDAILVAVPHYDHPKISIEGLEKGVHVMCEKPAGVYTKQVMEMNAAAEKSDKIFAIMFNQRTNPVYQKVRDLVQSGELGNLKRVVWIITNWYRSQSYHDSGSWRSTWSGEGGGVLINQCPHNIDLWQWMFGMPKRIRSFCSFGKYYNIEVEDDVTAYAEYENGMTATFLTSTGEAPGTNRLEVSGDMGKLVVEDDVIKFYRNRVSEREFNSTWTKGFGGPEVWECTVPVNGENLQHIGVLRKFTNAILNGEDLVAPGTEGINALNISNAIHLSTWLDDWVEIPVDADLYYEKLQEKIKNSTYVKPDITGKTLDTKGTY